jgi:hypothetical protein
MEEYLSRLFGEQVMDIAPPPGDVAPSFDPSSPPA